MGGDDKDNPLYSCNEEDDKIPEQNTRTILYHALDNWTGPGGTHGIHALDDIRRQCVSCLAHGKIPVFGLKSGALIYYETLDEDQKKGYNKDL